MTAKRTPKNTTAETTPKYRHTPGPCPECGVDIFDPENRGADGRVVHAEGCKTDAAARRRDADYWERVLRYDEVTRAARTERAVRQGRASATPRAERPQVDVHDFQRGERNRCTVCGGARNIKAHTHMQPKEA